MNISIHVPREGHDPKSMRRRTVQPKISIHVPREGHDGSAATSRGNTVIISIHVPREGHDHCLIRCCQSRRNFYPRAP